MLLNLVLKELKNTSIISRIKKGNIFGTILSIILSLGFVVLEVVVYSMLSNKLKKYEGATDAFLVVFLFAVTVILIFYLSIIVGKSLYNKEDNTILLTKPIPPYINTLSKVLYIYIKNVGTNYLITVPILLAHASNTFVMPRIYFLILLYPIIISIFETGLAYIISIPIHEISKFLNRHNYIKMALSAIFSVGFCFIYYYILSTFLTLVRDNNILSIFSESTIASFKEISKFLVPTSLYIEVLSENYESLLILLGISLGVFIIGTVFGSNIYLYNLKNTKETKRKYKEKEYELVSVNKALLHKELKILFEDSSSSFSYSSLLLAQPFLTVLVVLAMNTIFSTGMLSFVTSYFPYVLQLIQILFVILFAAFINTSASLAISREHNCLRILKTIPVSYRKQILIKIAVPFAGTLIMTSISVLCLILLKQISLLNGLLTILYALTLCLLLELISIDSDLRHPVNMKDDNSKSSLTTLGGTLLPILEIAIMFFLNYLGLPFFVSFFIAYLLLIVALVPFILYFKKYVAKRFVALEMRN